MTCRRAVDFWISLVSSTNKTDRHDITVVLLKVALNTINLILAPFNSVDYILLFKKYIILYGVCYFLQPLIFILGKSVYHAVSSDITR